MANIIIKTDQTGANDPISVSFPRTFNFSIGSAYTLTQGQFVLKKGSGSTDGIIIFLF